MDTLLELLPRMRALGSREALRYHNGYRTQKLSYSQLYARIALVARNLSQRGLGKGDRVLLWGENRPEWLYVFWACLARGIEVVPLDYRFSGQLAARIQQEAAARLLVTGDEVDASRLDVERISFESIAQIASNEMAASSSARALAGEQGLEVAPVTPQDVVEIVYTSGTTGEPKGVVHRHRNIASNLTAINREIERYRWLARPFQPIRLLDLLPLSHLFGQSTGLFVPVLLGGAVTFTSDLSPGALMETARRERASVLVGVPRMLANLRHEIERGLPEPVRPPRGKGLSGALESWLRYRKVHARLGWKFWALVVGGASLDRGLEDFWRWAGFAVVQGYGLTEASPVIAVNHPFHSRRGSIGAAIAGQEIKLGPDGEILVRGPSIVSEYFAVPRGARANAVLESSGSPTQPETPKAPGDGWLHTGDIAEIDAEGHLYYRGRKKEMIVRPDGLNVYPQDVEAVLARLPGVREAVVVGIERSGEERVHASVIFQEGVAGQPQQLGDAVVREANSQLEAHQRIQSWSVWPGDDFPRTASTLKVRRAEVAKRVAGAASNERPGSAARVSGIQTLLAEITGRDAASFSEDQKLEEDLGLTSLERVELLARIESHYGIELDEERFAGTATIGDLQHWLRESERPSRAVRQGGPASTLPRHEGSETADAPERAPHTERSEPSPGQREPVAPAFLTQPRWTRALPTRLVRAALLDLAILPMVRELVRLKVEGRENLDPVVPPVIFVANHTSHFDTAVIQGALPARWRRRVAPAMSQDFFRPLFEPRRFPREKFWEAAGQFLLACGLFNAYPLPQKMGGARRALRYTGELLDRGYCPLVYPEGERSPTGRMLAFKSGIGLMARRLAVPVVPIHLEGVFEVYSAHHEWPNPGRVTVRIGRPLRFEAAGDYLEAARQVEQAVRALRPERAKP